MSIPGKTSEGHNSHLDFAFTRALRAFFPTLKTNDIKLDFFAVYQKEAEAYDREFTQKYDEDLNTTLIFAGLFSAVTTSFVLDVQNNLQPDHLQETAALLRALLQKTNNSTFSESDIPSQDFTPDPVIVDVQVLLYASLGASLLAAFLAVLGKQWLNRYVRGKGGSAIERCRDRQRKADGMKDWLFPVVMETLPLMLQAALLLLGVALSRYLWTIDHVVAVVNIAITSAGMLVYLILIVLASSSYGCPYQTPFSLAICHLVDYDKNNTHYLLGLMSWLTKIQQRVFDLYTRISDAILNCISSQPATQSGDIEDGIRIAAVHMSTNIGVPIKPIFEGRKTEVQDNFTNASCICWILETSTDPDIISSTIQFIPEVNWFCDIKTFPTIKPLLEVPRGYITPVGQLTPAAKGKLYTHIKSIAHLHIQRAGVGLTRPIFMQHFGSFVFNDSDDVDLQDVLGLLSNFVFGFSLFRRNIESGTRSASHLSWLCHVLVHEVWTRKGDLTRVGSYSKAFYAFVKECLSCRPGLPSPAVVDCVLMMALERGMPLNSQDLSVMDKTKELPRFLQFIIVNLGSELLKSHHERAVEILRTLACLEISLENDDRGRDVISSLQSLFQQVVGSNTGSDANWKWECARLLLRIEFKIWRFPVSNASSLDSLLDYMDHEAALLDDGGSGEHDQPFTDVLIAIGKSVNIPGSHPSRSRFANGICRALEHTKNYHLSRVGLSVFFTPGEESASVRTLSSALCQFWAGISDELREIHWVGYVHALRTLSSTFDFLPLLISDHLQIVAEIMRRHRDPHISALLARTVVNVGDPYSLSLLQREENRWAVIAWLRLAWETHPHLSRVPHQIFDLTCRFILHRDVIETDLLEILPAIISWIQLDGDVEQRNQHVEVLEICLKHIWKQPGLRWKPELAHILDCTMELYRRKGFEGMDPGMLHAWLQFVWTNLDEVCEEAVEVTVEVFRRGDQSTVERYHALANDVRVELESLLAYAKLMKGTAEFDETRCGVLRRKLVARGRIDVKLEALFQTPISTF